MLSQRLFQGPHTALQAKNTTSEGLQFGNTRTHTHTYTHTPLHAYTHTRVYIYSYYINPHIMSQS